MTTYVTETGSKYEINYEKGLWSKNDGPKERIWWAHGVDPEEAEKCRNWRDVSALDKLDITPGVRLYIGSRDEWWLSSVIMEVREDG